MQHEVMTSIIKTSKRHGRVFTALPLCLAFVGTLAGCRESAATPNAQAVQQGSAHADVPDVLATIGDEKITMANVRERAGDQLDQIETQYRSARSKVIETALDSLLRQRVLAAEAKKQGKSVGEVIGQAIGATQAPSDLEIEA